MKFKLHLFISRKHEGNTPNVQLDQEHSAQIIVTLSKEHPSPIS